MTLIRRVAPGEEQPGPGSQGSAIPSIPLLPPLPQSVSAPGSHSPARPPSCGSHSGPAEGRRCVRLTASAAPSVCVAGGGRAGERGGGAFPPPASPWTARPQPRPPPQPRSPSHSTARGSAAGVRTAAEAKLGRTGAAAAPPPPRCPGAAARPQPGWPRTPAHHHPGLQPRTSQRVFVICVLARAQIQPRISPRLALVGMASLSPLGPFKVCSRTFSKVPTPSPTLSGAHMSSRYPFSTQTFLSRDGLAKPHKRWTAKGPLTHPAPTAECRQTLHLQIVRL